jgi:hypothetical protein
LARFLKEMITSVRLSYDYSNAASLMTASAIEPVNS